MIWKITDFTNKCFDAIIGQNLLKPLSAVIDLSNDTLNINNNKIKFLNSFPYNSKEICQLENEKIDFDSFLTNLNCEEQKALKNLLKNFKDLFFKEGDTLTSTTKIEHEIITTSNIPIYSKIYRYPQIHEQEISSQIADMLKQGIIRESNSPYNK